MADLILHIGAGKCGSSALQSYLTANPIVKKGDAVCAEYIALNARLRTIYTGEGLRKRAGVYGYAVSSDAVDLKIDKFRILRDKLAASEHDLIISNEGWVHRPEEVIAYLKRSGIKARVVMYVRPQPPVINSAWWQWGAWDGSSINDYVAHRERHARWGNVAKHWLRHEVIKSFEIRPVREDVVADFIAGVLGCDAPGKTSRANQSLSAEYLRLFQAHDGLRHGPAIESALSKNVPMRSRTPWVLEPAMVAGIIQRAKASNRAMLDLMDADSRKHVESDAAWWEPEAYADKLVASADPVPLENAELQKMCADMVTAIYRLEQRLAK